MAGGWLPWVLIVLGVLFLLEQFHMISDIGQFWPLILIAIGFSMLMPGRRRMRREERWQERTREPEPPASQAPANLPPAAPPPATPPPTDPPEGQS